MKISAIVAVTDDNAIGHEGGIPWHLPADLAHMKQVTTGHPIIMGRKTHESIGRTLPGRLNVVISRNPETKVFDGSVLVGSLDEALNLDEVKAANEVFIFGGEEIYRQAMPMVKKIYMTKVHVSVPADKIFPYEPEEWGEVACEKHQKDGQNPYDYEFCVLERLNS